MLHPGIYEQVINASLAVELEGVAQGRVYSKKIDPAEVSMVLTKYLTPLVRQSLDIAGEKDQQDQIALVNKIIALLGMEAGHNQQIPESAQQLLALLEKNDPRLAADSNIAKKLPRPQTSLIDSTLFTGAPHEPQMYGELKKEIASSNVIYMLVSFIKWSGLRLIIDELREFTQNGGCLKVITTSYMGATDVKAIDELCSLPNTQIRVSYDTKRTRLHAKAYLFQRNTGFTTAYVGSSNLSNAAISSGLEWNLKVTAKDMGKTIDRIRNSFESYWESPEFEDYTSCERDRLACALRNEQFTNTDTGRRFIFDIRPYPYQSEILDALKAERDVRGHHRNLVVAATGTGKTIVAAFDYKRFCKEQPKSPCRLLFVAHRAEILQQSMEAFRGVLQDANFGELFDGNHSPEKMDYVFASIQTINSRRLWDHMTPDQYQYVVVDEFHHAAAESYKRLLEYIQPNILLGLTATPERMDGEDILKWFDGRIAAEIRLPEAIDRKLLCPFQYFGVTDSVDLSAIRWTQGGYDKSELESIYTLNAAVAERRAQTIIESVAKYVTDMNKVKGVGFCVSVKHAEYMAQKFMDAGIPAMALSGNSSDAERTGAKEQLQKGIVRFIFVVDLYNEGVDIPDLNTVLFLRPTESLTVFLQQLGRGLRLHEDKECLTVLDFIGQAHKRYNFEQKFAALLENTQKSINHEIKHGFVSAPKGCYIQLEQQAREYILSNIAKGFDTKSGLITKLECFTEDSGLPVNLDNFLTYHRLDPHTVYKSVPFSRMCALAHVTPDFQEPAEMVLTSAFPKLCSIDSRRWIAFLRFALPRIGTIDFAMLPPDQLRMARMLYITLWGTVPTSWSDPEVVGNIQLLAHSPRLVRDMLELLEYKYNHIDFIDEQMSLAPDCPLDLYCSYTRDQLFCALDVEKPSSIREGVKWLPAKQLDVLLITLNKSDKDYSPSTMYDDYSINEEYFHWQSQSTTSEASKTGQRYIHHREQGSNVVLFVRENRTEHGIAAPYTCLGLADYERHEGSRPMSITWRLRKPIPAKYLRKTNRLIAG